jgi:acetyl-CoA C-acetyltransferase
MATAARRTPVPKPAAARIRKLEAKGRPVYIVDGARTPFLKASNKPGPFTPVDLAVQAGRPLLTRQPFDPREIDDIILGCVNVHTDEVNPGRVAGLRLGCGPEVPGWTVQRNCASGQQSIDTAWRYIAAGHADLILAGGAEALSHAPMLFSEKAAGWFGEFFTAKTTGQKLSALQKFKPTHLKPSLSILRGLTDPVVKLNMGQTAEILAHRFGISRAEADAFAVQSHKRLAEATEQGRIEEMHSIIDGKGNVYDHDTGVRPDNSVEQLSKLNPAFERPFGKVTAGNSSQITDGACWTILASDEAVKKYRLKPMARIIDCDWGSCDPSVMGLGPVLSSTKVMRKFGLTLKDIGAWEINEAFAAQVLACLKGWQEKDFSQNVLGLDEPWGELNQDILNVDGGAISLGHPVGTSGNRITLHVIHVMRRLGARLGIATECIGGGMGGAMLLEIV